MRYFATLPDDPRTRELDVEPLGDGQFAVTLDGVRHRLDALTIDSESVSLLVDGESYAVEFDSQEDLIQVRVRDAVVTMDVADERRLRMRAATRVHTTEGRQEIKAPMPGKVVKLLAAIGADVQLGQGLVVVEAMKMENELKSPKAGKVVEVMVSEGQAVEGGARLMVVE